MMSETFNSYTCDITMVTKTFHHGYCQLNVKTCQNSLAPKKGDPINISGHGYSGREQKIPSLYKAGHSRAGYQALDQLQGCLFQRLLQVPLLGKKQGQTKRMFQGSQIKLMPFTS